MARYNEALGNITDLGRRQEDDEYDFLELVRDVAMEQLYAGRLLVGENPAWSEAFRREPLKHMLENGYNIVRADMCQFGLHGDSGFHKKPTHFVVPAGTVFETLLGVTCNDE
jgi:hypothetical protein